MAAFWSERMRQFYEFVDEINFDNHGEPAFAIDLLNKWCRKNPEKKIINAHYRVVERQCDLCTLAVRYILIEVEE